MLTKTRAVLHLNPALEEEDCQIFETEQEMDQTADHRSIAVAIPNELWAEMGSPSIVTASVEPGDLLNE